MKPEQTQRAEAPKWLLERDGITQRQWRQRKRQELRAVAAAFETYYHGTAYCPIQNGELGALHKALIALTESHSIKNWGR